jgi:hypothetical protein
LVRIPAKIGKFGFWFKESVGDALSSFSYRVVSVRLYWFVNMQGHVF